MKLGEVVSKNKNMDGIKHGYRIAPQKNLSRG
jgi:hypothetical protein